ncbi:CIS tube protein [Kribbella sp. NPDC002412]
MTTQPAEDKAPTGAVLDVLDKKGKATKTIPVQFNPASLRLTMSNNVDGGTSRGRQAQQYNGSGSTQLHVELEFDTADEGTTDAPVDVRTRTAEVAQFVLPGGKGSKQAPPRVQFRWGSVAIAGVMTSLVEELDFFSADGVPLRAKATIDIKQQDPKFEALAAGAGANPDTGAQAAGEPTSDATGNGPGTAGTERPSGPDARTAEALDGESAADFLTRNDQPPEAWRAIAGLVGDALSLAAGTSIDFSASLDVGVGIGISAGFEAGLDVSVGAQAGLDAAAAQGVSAGFALAAAGGLSAAIEQSAIEQATAVANQSRAAFGTPVTTPGVSTGTASPSVSAGPASRRTAAQLTAAPRPLPPRADPRATSYGRGVPLRDRVTPDASLPGAGGWTVIAPLRPPQYAVPAVATDCGCSCGGGNSGLRQQSAGSAAAVVAPARQPIGMWGRSRPRKGCCG